MLRKEENKCLIEWEPINKRSLTALFKSKFHNVTLIQCYAPTNQAEQATIDEFYEQL
ncbi:hypothetical protein DPMN_061697 [Dreissena polymorpha]|uniref:Uncharacterized protein n=1 Tax=Dreissena polymorpha TaxID=45954 RepID=A0A9D4C7G9_DREPO|nr:hypothetical protein DPMN_061697 [Dreissena polymorpha]